MKQLLITIAALVLVGCGPSAPDISIHEAASEGNIEAVKQHLAAGADVNVQSDFRKYTPLHEAIVGRKLEVANFLIEKGANVNMMDDTFGTPLDIAIMRGTMTEIVDLLRKHGGKTGEELKAAAN